MQLSIFAVISPTFSDLFAFMLVPKEIREIATKFPGERRSKELQSEFVLATVSMHNAGLRQVSAKARHDNKP